MYIFLLKLNNFKALFLLFIISSTIIIIFNVWFPHEAFAMSPPQDTDDVIRSFNPDTYIRHELDGNPVSKINIPECLNPGKKHLPVDYGQKELFGKDYYGKTEYLGKDAYGYFHSPQNLNKGTQVEPLTTSKTISDNSPNIDYSTKYRGTKCKPEYELHLFKGKNVNSLLVSDKQSIICELDADQYEDTISTSMNSIRLNEAIEFVRNYKVLVDHPKHGMLSSLSLGIKTINNNIVFLYIKCKEFGRRKVLWNIWDKNRGKYESYKHFRRSWNSNIGIWSKIEEDVREDIRVQVEDLLGIKKINKDLKRSVRKEVEKLLREQQPFKY